jgi:hypothetical protein
MFLAVVEPFQVFEAFHMALESKASRLKQVSRVKVAFALFNGTWVALQHYLDEIIAIMA